MNRDEMLTELRSVVDDTGDFVKWEDETLQGYLAEGQDRFCEDTGYFRDISTFTLILEAGEAFYAVDDRVIQVLNIYDGVSKLSKILTGDSDNLDLQGMTQTGRPKSWTTDHSTGFIRLAPVPTSAENGVILALHVWRYSLYDVFMQSAGSASTPDIPARLQRGVIEWAAYKAFMHHDAETQDPVKARDHLEAYRDYVARGHRALRRVQNQETRITSDPAYRT